MILFISFEIDIEKLLIAYIHRVQQQHINRHTQRQRERVSERFHCHHIHELIGLFTFLLLADCIRLRIQKLSEFILSLVGKFLPN